jgi:hypothetical protein
MKIETSQLGQKSSFDNMSFSQPSIFPVNPTLRQSSSDLMEEK